MKRFLVPCLGKVHRARIAPIYRQYTNKKPLKKRPPPKKGPKKGPRKKLPKKGPKKERAKKTPQKRKGPKKNTKRAKTNPQKVPQKKAPPKKRTPQKQGIKEKAQQQKKKAPKPKGSKKRAPPKKKKEKGATKKGQKKGLPPPKKPPPPTPPPKHKKKREGPLKKGNKKKAPEKRHQKKAHKKRARKKGKKTQKAPKNAQKNSENFFVSTIKFPSPITHENSRIRGNHTRNLSGNYFSLRADYTQINYTKKGLGIICVIDSEFMVSSARRLREVSWNSWRRASWYRLEVAHCCCSKANLSAVASSSPQHRRMMSASISQVWCTGVCVPDPTPGFPLVQAGVCPGVGLITCGILGCRRRGLAPL